MNVPHDDRSQLEKAIDAVEGRKHEQAAIMIPVLRQPHAWAADAEVTLLAPEDQSAPALMIWDPGEQAWRLIILPPTSEWRIVPSYRPRIVVPRQ